MAAASSGVGVNRLGRGPGLGQGIGHVVPPCPARRSCADHADLPQGRADRRSVFGDAEQDQCLGAQERLSHQGRDLSGVKRTGSALLLSRRATSARSGYQPPVISRTEAATSASDQPAAIISWRIRT